MRGAEAPRLDYVLDLETEGWERFVLGGIYDGESFEAFDWRRERDLFDWILTREPGSQIWAWNGGKFDWIWALDWCIRERIPIDVSFSGSGMSALIIKDGPTLRDGVKLYPATLRKAARLAGIEMSKDVGLSCVCDDSCGGYCSIRRGMPAAQLDRLTRYLREDCVALWAIMETILSTLETEGFEIRGTIGGTAWTTARALCGVGNAEWPNAATYKRAREGYYGGRVQVFRPRAETGHRYDIHSAYPAALDRLDLPVGPSFGCDAERASKAFALGRDGIYTATVKVPVDSFIPPLPARTGERLSYPIGTFSGAWTGLELRYAMECGATVEKIAAGLVWLESAPALRDYQTLVWGLRSKADGEWRKFWKWYANSLTGKLAQQPENESYILNPTPDDIKRCPASFDCKDGSWCQKRKCCPHRCTGRCGAWTMKDGRGIVWARKSWRIASSGHVHWAAHLTASARIQLHQQLTSIDSGNDAIYCDTDSVYAINKRIEGIGYDLGEWGYDGPLADWHSIAPKSYAYRDPRDDSWHVRAKGMSGIKASELVEMANGKDVEIIVNRGIASAKTGLIAHRKDGGPVMRRKNLTRRNRADSIHYGDRILGNDGRTYPQSIGELTNGNR